MLQSPPQKNQVRTPNPSPSNKKIHTKKQRNATLKNRLPPSIRHTLHHHFHYFLTFQAVGEFEGFDFFAFFVLFLFVGFGVLFLIW